MAITEIVLPALLRAARGAYGNAIRERLAEAGCEDMPRNGPFVLGGMANQGVAARDLLPQLGVSKQAASQLVDTLVLRGYLDRQPDPEDRRRTVLQVTDRGRAAAEAIRAGVASVDEQLARRVSADELAGLRRGLLALIEIREEGEERNR